MLATCLDSRGYTKFKKNYWVTPWADKVTVIECTTKEVPKILAKNHGPRCVVLMTDADTPHANCFQHDTYFEFFAANEPCMIVDVTKNTRVKPHRIATTTYETKHLPKIESIDVQVRWIGARVGDVVQVGEEWFEVVHT